MSVSSTTLADRREHDKSVDAGCSLMADASVLGPDHAPQSSAWRDSPHAEGASLELSKKRLFCDDENSRVVGD